MGDASFYLRVAKLGEPLVIEFGNII